MAPFVFQEHVHTHVDELFDDMVSSIICKFHWYMERSKSL